MSGGGSVLLEVENEGGITLFDVEFKDGGGEMEIAHDGTVIEIATIVEMKDIPKAAADAIREVATGGEIKVLERVEERAKIEPASKIAGWPRSAYNYFGLISGIWLTSCRSIMSRRRRSI